MQILNYTYVLYDRKNNVITIYIDKNEIQDLRRSTWLLLLFLLSMWNEYHPSSRLYDEDTHCNDNGLNVSDLEQHSTYILLYASIYK